jgi:hypothetical protein
LSIVFLGERPSREVQTVIPIAWADRSGVLSQEVEKVLNSDGDRTMQTAGGSLHATQWKPEETSGNAVVTQRDFGGVAQVKEYRRLPAELVAHTPLAGAFNHCLLHAGMTDEEVAKKIHISKGYMSKLLRSIWVAQLKRLIRFMRETRCIAPLQVMAHEVGCDVVMRSPIETENERLRRENAELRAGRAVA